MIKKIIYADNAATTQMDENVFEAMKPYLLQDFSNPSQPYAFSRESKRAIRESRVSIAKCINAEPEEIYFTSGGTESDNWAIKGVCYNDDLRRRIVVSAIEHQAILKSCEFVEKIGYEIGYVPANIKGIMTYDALSSILTSDVKLVSIMLVNNEIGTIQPIKELCGLAHQKGSLFHTDAVQAVGHLKIDVKELGIDMLSASAHKFNGPKGIGFLYVKKGTSIVPFNNGGSQENNLRAGTENVASIVGMATALMINCNNDKSGEIEKIEKHFLKRIVGFGIACERNGSGPFAPGIISLAFSGIDGETMLHRLDLAGICVSTGSACDSVNTQISHVLKGIGVEKQKAIGTIRISFGKYNTIEDADAIANAIARILL